MMSLPLTFHFYSTVVVTFICKEWTFKLCLTSLVKFRLLCPQHHCTIGASSNIHAIASLTPWSPENIMDQYTYYMTFCKWS